MKEEAMGEPEHVHEWQPGPLLDGHRPQYTGDRGLAPSILLVCRCGDVARVAYPYSIVRHVRESQP